MPEYIVLVMPPEDEDAEPFGIPEWGHIEAIATAERYRVHGWEACVVDFGTPSVPWGAECPDGDAIGVSARTCDEACVGARAVGEDHDSFRRED